MYIKFRKIFYLDHPLRFNPIYINPIEGYVKFLQLQLDGIAKINDMPDKLRVNSEWLDNPLKKRLMSNYHEGMDTMEGKLLADIFLLKSRLSQGRFVEERELYNKHFAIDENTITFTI